MEELKSPTTDQERQRDWNQLRGICPFSINIKGRRVEYKMGQRIGEAAKRLSTRQQKEYFLSARAAASKTPYT